MSNRTSACPTDETLLQFLDTTAEDAQTEQHLNRCKQCRNRLESMSASKAMWSEARHFLVNPQNVGESMKSIDHDLESEAGLDHDYLKSILGPTDDPNMIGRIGTYEVCGVIGHGGTGIVLKAFDGRLSRYVAIKVLAPSFARIGSARRRFEREGKAVAAVSHDHVVPVHAVDEFQGLPYLVMQYVPGKSLQQRIDSEGPLDTKEIVRIGMQVAQALACAHAQGVIHRDVKPANILLENGVERVRVSDFGLAQVADDVSMTRSGVIAGTPQFMSPEQTRDETIDGRSDLFSLGSVMYAMCTGHSPFRSETVLGVLHRIATDRERPVREINPDIPSWLEQFIHKLLKKSQDDRFDSAKQVAECLSEELTHLQQPQRTGVPPRRCWLSNEVAPDRPRKAITFGGVTVLLAALACFFMLPEAPTQQRADHEEQRTEKESSPNLVPTKANLVDDASAAEGTTAAADHDAVVAQVQASIVQIKAVKPDGSLKSIGVGVIISPEGHVVFKRATFRQPLDGRRQPVFPLVTGEKLRFAFSDRNEVDGVALGSSQEWGIALAKLNEPGPWPAVKLCQKGDIQVGTSCMTLDFAREDNGTLRASPSFGKVTSVAPGRWFKSDSDCRFDGVFDVKGRLLGQTISILYGSEEKRHTHAAIIRELLPVLSKGENADRERAMSLLENEATHHTTGKYKKKSPKDTDVVTIARQTTVRIQPEQRAGANSRGWSGVVVSPDGHVVTCGHINQSPGDKVTVHFSSGKIVNGEVMGRNPITDIGMVRITDVGEWPFAELGLSHNMSRGDHCIVSGFPVKHHGLEPFVREAKVVESTGYVWSSQLFTSPNYDLHGGDSGGGVFDERGVLMAVNIGKNPGEFGRHARSEFLHLQWADLTSGTFLDLESNAEPLESPSPALESGSLEEAPTSTEEPGGIEASTQTH